MLNRSGQPGARAVAGAGVLVCHGFSGSPASVRDSAQYLIDQGAAVVCPLLPGHGTAPAADAARPTKTGTPCCRPPPNWLTERTRVQVVIGFVHGRVAGSSDQLARAGGGGGAGQSVGRHRLGDLSAGAAAGQGPADRARHRLDIKAQGVTEPSYPRAPLAAVASMRELWRLVVRNLDSVRVPVLLFTSREDHVVDGYSGRLLRRRLPQLTDHWLENSYHVATMDNDADFINRTTATFISDLLRAADEPQ